MAYQTLTVETTGERFYNITNSVQEMLKRCLKQEKSSGLFVLYVPHTSCALTINEAFDPNACRDLESFMKHIAPRNLSFITHTEEGSDDSPSHMKSILLQNSLTFFVENGAMLIGKWQGIYLAEFRDGSKKRDIHCKFIKEN